METVKIEHEGEVTQVELKPCRYCKRMPTAEDAQAAVAHERKMIRCCAVCGGKPKIYPRHALYHSVGCRDSVDKAGGRNFFLLCGISEQESIDPEWHPDWLVVYTTGPSGTVDGGFHVACLKRVAPGIRIYPR